MVAPGPTEARISERIRKLGLSLGTLAPLAGVNASTLSRWLTGAQHLPNTQAASLQDLLNCIEDLHNKLAPFKPDLTAEDSRLQLLKFRTNKIAISVTDLDPSGDKTREELEEIRNRFDVGISALKDSILNEAGQKALFNGEIQ